VLLEHLGERDIATVQAAALYRVSAHPERRMAGKRWLDRDPAAFGEFAVKYPAWMSFSLALNGEDLLL
jgi:hypothetical protein